MRKLKISFLAFLTLLTGQLFADLISLKFQDIDIRAALQILAEFENVNIVVNDSVQGNLTLNLDNVTYHEALTNILHAKGLSQVKRDNLILIGTKEEFGNYDVTESMILLQTEYFTLNYAKASDIANIIKDKNSMVQSNSVEIAVDNRTNTLLVKGSHQSLANIAQLIKFLDVPIRQVMIEAQIIETIDTSTEILGMYFRGGKPADQFKSNLFFDFNETAGGFAVATKLPLGLLIDLELKAAESEEKTKTIARPKIITQDGQTAIIETGQEIPYTTMLQQGSTPLTSFKTATLKLEVTPQITLNNMICMDLHVTDDSPSNVAFDGQVGINTTSISTKILINNGETIVLGGIFKTNDTLKKRVVPGLSKLPLIGKLFSFTNNANTKNEVLVFVTPRIIDNPKA